MQASEDIQQISQEKPWTIIDPIAYDVTTNAFHRRPTTLFFRNVGSTAPEQPGRKSDETTTNIVIIHMYCDAAS